MNESPDNIARGIDRARMKPGGTNAAARRLALRLLVAGEPRHDVVAALVLAFGFNADKAERLVAMAIKRQGDGNGGP